MGTDEAIHQLVQAAFLLPAYSTEFARSVHAEFVRSFRGFSPTLGGRASGRRESVSESPLIITSFSVSSG
jgi:hypothetical protein